MTDVVFYFQVHQPWRLKPYRFFDIGRDGRYFDERANAEILRRVAYRSYLPMNDLIAQAIARTDGAFRCAFSISGTALEQLRTYAPEVIDSYRRLVDTGCVELLAETSHHSLASLYDEEEFEAQVRAHAAQVHTLFGVRPTTFRNTELTLSNDIARKAEAMGFTGVLGEGADHLLGWRSPHHVYRPRGCERVGALLRSYRLSDDIAFRYSDKGWKGWPLTVDRFAGWIEELPADDEVVGLFMDVETFGEHQDRATGIFDFMAALPERLLSGGRVRFATPAEALAHTPPAAELDIPWVVSWADQERDLTAWLGNQMQRSAAKALYRLGPKARAAAEAGRPDLLASWRRLTTSDHVYYMSTKFDRDGDIHRYFSPYPSPYDAFITFMNVLGDLRRRLDVAVASASDEVEALAAG